MGRVVWLAAIALVLVACSPARDTFEQTDAVRLFLAMAPDATYSETRLPNGAIADIVAAECPRGVLSARGVYRADGASLIVYAADRNISCAIFRPASQKQLVVLPRADAPEGVALTVNGVPVTIAAVDVALAALPAEIPRDEAALGQILNKLINDELLRQEAADIAVSDAEIADARATLLARLGIEETQVPGYLAARNLDESALLRIVDEQARTSALLGERLLIDDVNVSEDALREVYIADPNRFLQSEFAVMRHLLVSSAGRTQEQLDARARLVAARLESGDFCAAVEEFSDDKKEQCGTFAVPRGALGQDLEYAAFNTPQNLTSVVVTNAGIHFVQTLHVVPSQVTPFAQAQGTLRSSILSSALEQRLSLYLTMLRANADIVLYTK